MLLSLGIAQATVTSIRLSGDQKHRVTALSLAASAIAPIITLLFLLTSGRSPLFGWGTLWQLLVMALGGAIATPVFFELFRLLDRAFGYRRVAQSSFRPDREIRRGRN